MEVPVTYKISDPKIIDEIEEEIRQHRDFEHFNISSSECLDNIIEILEMYGWINNEKI